MQLDIPYPGYYNSIVGYYGTNPARPIYLAFAFHRELPDLKSATDFVGPFTIDALPVFTAAERFQMLANTGDYNLGSRSYMSWDWSQTSARDVLQRDSTALKRLCFWYLWDVNGSADAVLSITSTRKTVLPSLLAAIGYWFNSSISYLDTSNWTECRGILQKLRLDFINSKPIDAATYKEFLQVIEPVYQRNVDVFNSWTDAQKIANRGAISEENGFLPLEMEKTAKDWATKKGLTEVQAGKLLEQWLAQTQYSWSVLYPIKEPSQASTDYIPIYPPEPFDGALEKLKNKDSGYWLAYYTELKSLSDQFGNKSIAYLRRRDDILGDPDVRARLQDFTAEDKFPNGHVVCSNFPSSMDAYSPPASDWVDYRQRLHLYRELLKACAATPEPAPGTAVDDMHIISMRSLWFNPATKQIEPQYVEHVVPGQWQDLVSRIESTVKAWKNKYYEEHKVVDSSKTEKIFGTEFADWCENVFAGRATVTQASNVFNAAYLALDDSTGDWSVYKGITPLVERYDETLHRKIVSDKPMRLVIGSLPTDWTTWLLLGGAAVAAFFILKQK